MNRPALTKVPPPTPTYTLTYPSPETLLVTITRPSRMNSIPQSGHLEGEALWNWYDSEPNLRCAIITGAGDKAFCAGADLIEQKDISLGKVKSVGGGFPTGGFAGLSKRVGKKPVIAAVNGFALGGGFEIALNCDMIVASPTATFGLPEALRGLYAAAGGLPRVVRNLSMQLASEIALTGRTLSVTEAKSLQLVNVIAASQAETVPEAIRLAEKVASLSPDAVIVSRAGLREAWETASVERAYQLVEERFGKKLWGGENMRRGLEAFVEKRKPVWVPSKL